MDLYDAAREITGSRYDGATKCVVAPLEIFEIERWFRVFEEVTEDECDAYKEEDGQTETNF